MSTELAAAAGEAPPALTGWERLGRLFSYAFARHDEGAEVGGAATRASRHVALAQRLAADVPAAPAAACSPAYAPCFGCQRCCIPAQILHPTHLQVPPMPEELREWSQDTLTATAAGLVFGGGKRWLDERGAGAHSGLTIGSYWAGNRRADGRFWCDQGCDAGLLLATSWAEPGRPVPAGRLHASVHPGLTSPSLPSIWPVPRPCRHAAAAARRPHQAARGQGDSRGEHAAAVPSGKRRAARRAALWRPGRRVLRGADAQRRVPRPP